MPPQKALESVGKALQSQYEHWHPRVTNLFTITHSYLFFKKKAKYKLCVDPTLDEVKKLCLALRRIAKDDRVLFHYNGHGVPKPTNNGEIWVFNKVK